MGHHDDAGATPGGPEFDDIDFAFFEGGDLRSLDPLGGFEGGRRIPHFQGDWDSFFGRGDGLFLNLLFSILSLGKKT